MIILEGASLAARGSCDGVLGFCVAGMLGCDDAIEVQLSAL